MSNEKKATEKAIGKELPGLEPIRATAIHFLHPGVQELWDGHNGRTQMLREEQLAKLTIFRDSDVYVVMRDDRPGMHWEFPVERVEVMEFTQGAAKP